MGITVSITACAIAPKQTEKQEQYTYIQEFSGYPAENKKSNQCNYNSYRKFVIDGKSVIVYESNMCEIAPSQDDDPPPYNQFPTKMPGSYE